MTSFVLSDLSLCRCHLDGSAENQKNTGSQSKPSSSKLCRRCNKLVTKNSRVGSMTSFFFQEQRCQCKVPLVDAKIKAARSALPSALPFGTRTGFAGDDEKLKLAIKEGELVANAFQIIELLGEGGMASVYKARQTALNRICAIKFLAPSLVSSDNFQRFRDEALISAALNHKSICHIYDMGIHKGVLPYYAMDYIDGGNLEEVISFNGPISVGSTLEIFLEICDGLAYAHRKGVIHKDLKPANFMLFYGEEDSIGVKVLDFGISELAQQKRSRANSQVVGSAAYMSPEQFGNIKIDKRTDIYSLGVSMFQTLTGVTPFEGSSVEELERAHRTIPAPSLQDKTEQPFPAAIEAIVAKCLEKDPDRRYQSASELAIDLQRVLDDKEPQFADSLVLAQENAKKRTNLVLPILLTSLVVTGLTAYTLTLSKDVFNKTTMPKSAKPNFAKPNSAKEEEKKAATEVNKDLSRAVPKDDSPFEKVDSLMGAGQLESQFSNLYNLDTAAVEDYCKKPVEPYRSQYEREGKRLYRFSFPTKFSLGGISVYNKDSKALLFNVIAQNIAEVPIDTICAFTPDKALYLYPQLLNGFKRGDINMLIFTGDEVLTAKILKDFSRLNGIKDLCLIESIESEAGIVQRNLCLYPELERIYVQTVSLDFSRLGRADLPARLKNFTHFGKTQEAKLPALSAFAGMRLQHLETKVKAGDYQNLSQLKSVETLVLHEASLKPEDIRAVAQIAGLKKLTWLDCNIQNKPIGNAETSEIVAAISRLPLLEEVQIQLRRGTKNEIETTIIGALEAKVRHRKNLKLLSWQ